MEVSYQALMSMSETYFRSSVILLEHKSEIGPYRHAPVYYCVCHGLELALKAYIVKKHPSFNTKSLSHSLSKCAKAAQEMGFVMNLQEIDFVKHIDQYIHKHEFRYPVTGYKSLPVPEDLIYCFSSVYNRITQEFISGSEQGRYLEFKDLEPQTDHTDPHPL